MRLYKSIVSMIISRFIYLILRMIARGVIDKVAVEKSSIRNQSMHYWK